VASKIGEDMARPGQVLLTPAAAEALHGRTRRRVSRHGAIRFGLHSVPVHEIKLG
jgi:hypothetical protein